MKKNIIRWAAALGSLTLATTLAACGGSSSAGGADADFPTRDITMLVPYAAGGPTDISARALATEMEKELDTTVIVENRPGASGITGLSEAASAKADGYTMVFSTDDSFVQSVKRTTPYSFESFDAVGGVFTQPYLIVVPSSSEITNVEGLRKAGKLNYAVTGWANPTHVNQAAIFGDLGLDATAIPFDGAAPAAQAMIGGQTDVAMLDAQAVMPYIKNDDLRVLAVLTADGERLDYLPDAPTFEEAGLPVDNQTLTMYGIAVPTGTDEAIVSTLKEATNTARVSESFTKLSEDNYMPLLSEEDAANWYTLLQEKSASTVQVMKQYNITVE
ncbi:Bug family tripartite tricarboxylate transporter substrate binding protein [Glutamicibacter uratoxydans]|uniref:Bug family tripartite tricarboxylate transporter substrate binding protein n=1 Tax=Glutamicibacter uratoxydans TaxID=43667 RepID=UPI003D6EB0C6